MNCLIINGKEYTGRTIAVDADRITVDGAQVATVTQNMAITICGNVERRKSAIEPGLYVDNRLVP